MRNPASNTVGIKSQQVFDFLLQNFTTNYATPVLTYYDFPL